MIDEKNSEENDGKAEKIDKFVREQIYLKTNMNFIDGKYMVSDSIMQTHIVLGKEEQMKI
ncbi:MAG: hypothetical protein B6I28_04505 [Fusobacteriia bacterium 4572_132]|nr:MAG: hypothetical protein B6I28_04505 [Fusobacteriia bacterium 4572_132]